MNPDVCNESPPQLARFPQEIRDAYRRFRSSQDLTAAQEVVAAAVVDFLPGESIQRKDAPLRDDQSLVDDLGYDSLAIAEIVFFLEDLFGVVIKTEDLKSVRTVGDLREFVSRKLATPPSRA